MAYRVGIPSPYSGAQSGPVLSIEILVVTVYRQSGIDNGILLGLL